MMFTLDLTRKRLEVYLKLKTLRNQIYQSHWTLSFCPWCSPFWMQGRYDKDMLVGLNETRATAIWWATRLDGRGMLKTHSETWLAQVYQLDQLKMGNELNELIIFVSFQRKRECTEMPVFYQEPVRPSCVIDLKPCWKTWWFRAWSVTSKAMNHLIILPNIQHQPVELENLMFMVAVIPDEIRQRQMPRVSQFRQLFLLSHGPDVKTTKHTCCWARCSNLFIPVVQIQNGHAKEKLGIGKNLAKIKLYYIVVLPVVISAYRNFGQLALVESDELLTTPSQSYHCKLRNA